MDNLGEAAEVDNFGEAAKASPIPLVDGRDRPVRSSAACRRGMAAGAADRGSRGLAAEAGALPQGR